ncbi:MAG TPA: ABC transporter permease [Stellaceae bacterium]|nr:ABC transporter permease [Stellaceae bacterium]
MIASAARIRQQRLPYLLLLPAGIFLAVFFLVPLGEVVWLSVSEPRLSLANYTGLLTDTLYARVLVNTFVTALTVTLACLLLGYPLAYAIARTGGVFGTVLVSIVAMSFWTSFLVRTYAWMVILGNRGPVVAALKALGWDPPPLLLFTRFSSVLAMVHILAPFMIMALYAVMKKIDPAVLRAAASLGGKPLGIFRHVFLPLSAPGIVSGSTLVFVICLGFYVTPVLIGSPRELMIAGLIGDQMEQFLAFGPASAMALVLLAATLGVLAVYNRFFGLDRLWG